MPTPHYCFCCLGPAAEPDDDKKPLGLVSLLGQDGLVTIAGASKKLIFCWHLLQSGRLPVISCVVHLLLCLCWIKMGLLRLHLLIWLPRLLLRRVLLGLRVLSLCERLCVLRSR